MVDQFLSTRHPQYAVRQTTGHLASTQVTLAYADDVRALKARMKNCFYFLVTDETPTSKNVPILHVLARYVNVTSLLPVVETALLSSREVEGRCDATALVTELNNAVRDFELVQVCSLAMLPAK